jgi:hypothetical protein
VPGACLALVVLVHALVLSMMWPVPDRAKRPPSTRPAEATLAFLDVRQVVPMGVAEGARPAAPAKPSAAPAGAPPRPRADAPVAPRAAAPQPISPQPSAGERRPAPPADDLPVVVAAAPELEPAPPVYRTTPPAARTLVFDVFRGGATGLASLGWRLEEDGRYRLELQGLAAPRPPEPVEGIGDGRRGVAALAPHWRSEGRLDAAGLAPERFSVWRRGRERHAANFRRDAGLISFAGPSHAWPLLAGAQDRLSWMVQLTAVLQADPSLAQPGMTITMMVVGAHGEAGAWNFKAAGESVFEGPEKEALPVSRFVRESRLAHDPRVEVWLAPALQHLPVRMVLSLPSGGESTEFRLRALLPP